MVEQTVCRAPRAITHGWDPLLGDAGRKVTFKFIYRSRSKQLTYSSVRELH